MSRSRRLLPLIELLVAAAGIGACGSPQQSPAPHPTPSTSSSLPPAPPGTSTTSSTPTTSSGPSPTTAAPAGLPAWLAGKVWSTIPTTSRVVALTFDAGANADGLPSILSTLQRTGVPGTFFVTGNFARMYPALCAQVARSGFRVGDHTVDHPHLTQLSDAAVTAEVLDAATMIRAATGTDPTPRFRFPYGEWDARTLADVNRAGYAAIGWTVDTLGWKGTSAGVTTAEVVSRVLGSLRPGEIVLMHVGANPSDGSTLDADALAAVISAVRSAGYGFVSLSALAG